MSSISTRLPAVRTRSVIKAGAIAGILAGVVNVLVFLVAKAAGVDLTVKMGSSTSEVIFLQPLVSSFIAVFLGAVLLHVMLRLRSGVTIWTALAVVVFLAYTAYAFSAATSTGAGLVLTLMHVVALAAAFVIVLPVARNRASA